MRKSNNKNKIINIIIFVLFIMLVFMIYTIVHNYNNTKANTQAFNQTTSQNQTPTKTDDYAAKLEKLQTKLQETSELLVLEGTTQINCTYDNSNVLNVKDDNLNFLHRKFNELKIREIQVETEYKFGFTYSLENIQVNRDDKIRIMLSDNRLELKYIEEDKNKTVLTDKINLLASKFTPQEVNAIMARTKVGAFNTIQNDAKIIDEAMKNAKKNIEVLAKELGIDVEVEIGLQGLIENEDVNINEIEFNQ